MLKTEGYENSELFMALTPKNGFKASKLYSYKPIDGTGDFHWSRNHTAYRLNQSGVLELMGNNVPRVDYTNTCPELLIEKESENIFTHSQTFDNAIWVKRNSTINSNAILAPDNTTTADKIQEDTSLDRHDVFQEFNAVNGTTYTLSCFVKSAERTAFALSFGSGIFTGANNAQAYFNLSNGTIISSLAENAFIQPYSNGWYRIGITSTATSSSLAYFVGGPSILNNFIYQGVLNNGLYIWGAQLEESDYATSYIPTTTTAQTRPKDVCYNTANTFGDAAWSIVMRVRLNNIGSSTSEPLIALNDGSTDNYFCIYTDSNPKLYFDWYNNPDQLTLNTTDLTNDIYNVGVSYDDSTGDYIIVLDGSLEFAGNVGVSLAGAFTGSFNRLDLGTIAGTGNLDGDGIIGVQYYDSALTQTDLENLTTA